MAKAAAKRIGMSCQSSSWLCCSVHPAGQNESTVKTLKLGMILPTVISLVLRLLFRRGSVPPSKGALFLYTVTFFPAFFLSNYLIRIGTTRRDPTTGTLISYGEDLSQPGVTEWCFDILYVTCKSTLSQNSVTLDSGLNCIRRGVSNWLWCFWRVVLVVVSGGMVCSFFPYTRSYVPDPHLCRLQIVDLCCFAYARAWQIFAGPGGECCRHRLDKQATRKNAEEERAWRPACQSPAEEMTRRPFLPIVQLFCPIQIGIEFVPQLHQQTETVPPHSLLEFLVQLCYNASRRLVPRCFV